MHSLLTWLSVVTATNLIRLAFMMYLERLNTKSDLLGASASALCFVHCLATPFLFMAHAAIGAEHEASHPAWWGALALLFLSIAFLAVFWSAQKTAKTWMKYALWICWGLLALVVLNEKLKWFPLFEAAIYFPTLSLIFLHFYNRQYCQCKDETC